MDWSFIFSAEIITPPNCTVSDKENLAGDNFKLILLHNFISFPICSYNPFNVRENNKKLSICLRQSILIKLNISICDVVEKIPTAANSLAQHCKFKIPHLGHNIGENHL